MTVLVLLAACARLPGTSPRDMDGDGFDAAADCDDQSAWVHPGALERCNGDDDDCNGVVDDVRAAEADMGAEGPVTRTAGETWYRDADGDGFGNPAESYFGCAAPVGFVDRAEDCDDLDATSFPYADELCGDGVDQACDGIATECCDTPSHGFARARLTFRPGDSYSYVGAAVAAPGDLNGDGTGDLLVGGGGGAGGVAWLLSGARTGQVEAIAAFATITDAVDGQWVGHGVSGAPDWDGDGAADIALSAGGADSGTDAVCVFTGPLLGAATFADATTCWQASAAPSMLGGTLFTVGAVAGNDALLVADASAGNGAAYLLPAGAPGGEAAGMATGELRGDADHRYLGIAAASVGDLDGDGFGEVLLSDLAGDRTWLAPGPVIGTVPVAYLDAYGTTGKGAFAMGGAGDVDGDGLPDIWIGGWWGEKSTRSGTVYVWSGVAPAGSPPLGMLVGESRGDMAARAAPLGDLDGDGYGELVVGAAGSVAGSGPSALYRVPGPPAGVIDLSCAPLRLDADTDEDGLGAAFATPGDLDGDGVGEVLVGAPASGVGGAAFVLDGARGW
jgi:hypothetical protein